MRLLKFGSSSNAKLDKINEWHDGKRPPQVLNFSLPSGYSCPSARDCQSWFNPKTRKMTKGKDAKYTCFATTMQRNPSVMKINIKKAVVVHDEKSTTLPIDTNEYHAVNTNQDFALVVHGTQLK
jgi:hypothetical protein